MQPQHEYFDPAIYDAEYGGWTGDFNFFCGLKSHGRALDLACGTGRLTIALAQKGLLCTGIDENEKMLSHAKKKSAHLSPNVKIHYAKMDIKHFSFDNPFDLITLAGNSFQALLTEKEQKEMLYCVKTHLKEDGVFAFCTRNPRQADLKTTKDFEFWHTFTHPSGEDIRVYGRQTYTPKNHLMFYETQRIGKDHTTRTSLTLRFTAFDALKDLLHSEGLSIIRVYGDFDQTSFDPKQSPDIILTCRRAG